MAYPFGPVCLPTRLSYTHIYFFSPCPELTLYSFDVVMPLMTVKIRHWREINDRIPCPIAFADEELQSHYQDGEGWNEQAVFWESLDGIVHRDGWTSHENYDQAFEIFAKLRKQGLELLDGTERDVFE